jgi:hypothetical protein
MRYDGHNQDRHRTSIIINDDFYELSSLILGIFKSQKDIDIMFKELLKKGLKSGQNSEDVRAEIIKLIKKILKENEIKTTDQINGGL